MPSRARLVSERMDAWASRRVEKNKRKRVATGCGLVAAQRGEFRRWREAAARITVNLTGNHSLSFQFQLANGHH